MLISEEVVFVCLFVVAVAALPRHVLSVLSAGLTYDDTIQARPICPCAHGRVARYLDAGTLGRTTPCTSVIGGGSSSNRKGLCVELFHSKNTVLRTPSHSYGPSTP